MFSRRVTWCAAILSAVASGAILLPGMLFSDDQSRTAAESSPETAEQSPNTPNDPPPGLSLNPIKPRPIPEFLKTSLKWLAAAQQEDGGWGAGSHARQDIRDPNAVPSDPATTSFVAMTFLRVGHTPHEGEYKKQVRKATKFLIDAVESAPKNDPRITQLTGTQPQSKLGPLVDTSMTAQYFARLLPKLKPNSKLYAQVDTALDDCLKRLRQSQQADGSWNVGGGWAPVLQSSLACSSFELAKVAGKPVSDDELSRAREYQKKNFNGADGQVRTEAAAGVALYAFSGAQRANAGESKAAQDVVDEAKRKGELDADAPVNEDNLVQLGVAPERARRLAQANGDVNAAIGRLSDESLLAGFGSNGGEEFLSYLFTSESLIIQGPNTWKPWNDKLEDRLQKIQNKDGSWSGHHCITSPVFCTAAVVQCLTVDHDAKMLLQIAELDAQEAQAKN